MTVPTTSRTLTPRPTEFTAVSQGGYTVALARSEAEVRAAQRLRYEVFSADFDARLPGDEVGLDSDWFDTYCDHLLVTETATDTVVGTYRLLTPRGADAAGGRYAEGEFDLGPHAALADDLVEVGRSCVHPAHRDGAVIALMWAGIARYLTQSGHNWLAGCCSVPLGDGGELAREVRRRTSTGRYRAPAAYQVTPHRPWRPAGDATDLAGEPLPGVAASAPPLPALLRGYLRLGAWVCGEPAHDPEFDAADFYVLLSLKDMNPRYLRHFLGLTAR